eukprot:11985694-Alexandrium_andersonii.AAC.1
MARDLHLQYAQESDFLRASPKVRWFFLVTALLVKCTIAAVERRHAVHARSATPGTPWHMFRP